MRVSVVIPTYNGRDTLDQLIPVLLHQEFPQDDYEVIVVVDGSSDGTVEYLRSLGAGSLLRILEQPNRGPAVARNKGVAAASGDLILLLDDDMLVDASLVRRHAQAHRHGAGEVVVGRVPVAAESPDGLATDLMRSVAERCFTRLQRQGGVSSPFEVWLSTNWSIPRKLFLATGGYDECNSFQREDDDLAMCLWEAGVPFRFEPEIVAYHLYTKTIDELVRDYGARSAAGELHLCAKHPGYRMHTCLGACLRGPTIKRLVYWLMCCGAPKLSAASLGAAIRTLDSLRWIPFAKTLGIRIVATRIIVAQITTAISELGSLAKLRHELQL